MGRKSFYFFSEKFTPRNIWFMEINASWLDGITLIHRKVIQMLEAEGLHKIDAIGQAFDPLQHEAVSTEDSNEVATGYILEVLRNGYKLHDRIIQPAQVVVAR